VAEGLTLRITPRLIFHLDHSLQRGLETLRVIDDVMAESAPPPADAADEAAADGTDDDAAGDATDAGRTGKEVR
jgi:hypothetical protein